MKITIDIDCTPDEARTFFGLPNVKPIQDAMLSRMEERMHDALAAMDPETLMKNWLPMGLQGFEQLQKIFLSQLSAAVSRGHEGQ